MKPKDRQQEVASDSLIDTLTQLKDGQFVSVCYLTAAKIKKTFRGIDVDTFNQELDSMESKNDMYNQLKKYANKETKTLPFAGIVCMTTYVFNWQSEEKYRKNYAKYVQDRDKAVRRRGVSDDDLAAHNEKYSKSYDKADLNGTVSAGSTDNTQGRLYTHQNIYRINDTNKKNRRRYFLVNDEGDIIQEVQKNNLASLFYAVSKRAPYASKLVEKALQDLYHDDQKVKEELEKYAQELDDLRMIPMKLMYGSILAVSGTVNGIPKTIINDKLSDALKLDDKTMLKINADSFRGIIQPKAVADAKNALSECIMRNNHISLTESELKAVITEATKILINKFIL